MGSSVLLLSLLVALDPVRIGITALLLSRPRPMLNLFVFWLGGMVAGIATALVALVLIRDFALSVMRETISAFSSPMVAYTQVAIGGLAVLMAARFWARQRAPVPAGGERSALAVAPNRPTGFSRLPLGGHLEKGSLVVAFVAGFALATPPVEYLAAIIAILASGATATEQVGAAMMFTLVAFTVVEVPLVTYLATPAKTLAAMQRLNDWITGHRQPIVAAVVCTFGAVLVVTGMRNV